MKITITVMDIGPDTAERWLKLNVRNRNLSPKVVSAYARDMAAGRWVENGESIKFAKDGTLLDGQHRLAAIVKSGAVVRIAVAEGLAAFTQDTMDTGRKRTTGDMLGINGETSSNVLAAVVRRALAWEVGDKQLSLNVSYTNSECADFLVKHPEIRDSVQVALHVRRKFPYVTTAVAGLSHWVFAQIDQDDAAEFMESLATGASLPENHPVLALRQRFMTEKANQVATTEERRVGYVFRAWNAYRTGQSMSRIVHAVDDPIPTAR